jgi:hypothetical protein
MPIAIRMRTSIKKDKEQSGPAEDLKLIPSTLYLLASDTSATRCNFAMASRRCGRHDALDQAPPLAVLQYRPHPAKKRRRSKLAQLARCFRYAREASLPERTEGTDHKTSTEKNEPTDNRERGLRSFSLCAVIKHHEHRLVCNS